MSQKAHKKYDEYIISRQLNQKADIKVNTTLKKILILVGKEAKGDLGIHSRGKIDFLINFRDYKREYVDKF